jgi:hypothetical protein
MIPIAVRERKKASTCNQDTAWDAQLKIVSFQKLFPARKDEMGTCNLRLVAVVQFAWDILGTQQLGSDTQEEIAHAI